MALPELTKTRISAEEFEQYVQLPENRDKKLEYHAGEIVEVVSNDRSSQVAARCLILLGAYVEANDLGWFTGADGGYIVHGERYIPNAAFISYARLPKPSGAAWNAIAPDLAIEVLSPTDHTADVLDKVSNYLIAEVTVWVIDPIRQTVTVFVPNLASRIFTINDTLDGGEVLPDFRLPVASIFKGL